MNEQKLFPFMDQPSLGVLVRYGEVSIARVNGCEPLLFHKDGSMNSGVKVVLPLSTFRDGTAPHLPRLMTSS